MGRTLERLSRTKIVTHRSEPAVPVRKPVAEPPAQPEVELEVPFIEIGPPGTPVDASPLVRATGPLPATRPAIRTAVPPVAPPVAAVAPVAIPEKPIEQGRGVAFQSLAGEAPAPFASELITYHQPDHGISRQYRELLAGLKKTLSGPHPQVLLFVATGPGIGATTAILNLAITAAREDRVRVIVVDANFPAPGKAARLGLSEAPGLKEVLTGRVALDEAVRETVQKGLWALTTGSAGVGRDDAVLVEKTVPLLAQLREEFDLLLVEGPAWESVGVPAMATAGDGLFVVLPHHAADQSATKELLRAIRRQARRPNGMILTQP